MRPILLLALALSLTSTAAATDAPPIHRFTLDNGMKVVVEPSPRSERAFVLVRYDVGSRDDPAGYHGLAHLTEHLSFRGNEVLTDYDDLGATSTNGITSPDHTYYSAHVPVAAVERALSIEGERMAFLLADLTERDLAHEQRIVTHEWKQRTHNVVSLSNVLAKLVFPDGHPYRLLADDPDDVAAVRLTHVQWFAQAAYRPERATLVVTGGVDAERVHAWAARYFGPVRSAPVTLARATPAPLGPLTRRCTVHVGQRTVDQGFALTWTAPPSDSEDAAALDVVNALLVGPRRARLAALTRADGPASEVEMVTTRLALTSLLTLQVRARRDEALDPMVTRIEEALRAIAAGAFDEKELSAARAHVLRRDDEAAEDPLTRALALADARDDAALARIRGVHARVTADDVKRVATRWLDPRRHVQTRFDCTRCVRDSVQCEEATP